MDLIAIFNDTMQRCASDEMLRESCLKTRERQQFYKAGKAVCAHERPFSTNIIVSKKRSFDAARAYKGERIGVLNFANSFSPGGGVVYGARAQEESLCRVSTLYVALTADEMLRDFYQAHRATFDHIATDDVIFSPEITVFKDDNTLSLLPPSEWFCADVLTCAAPDLNDVSMSEDDLFALHKKRWTQILSIAEENGCTVLILGAFGCGAFRNPPEVVAKAAKTVLQEFAGAFKTVEFAVACKNDWTNYEVFRTILGES